MTKLQKLPTEEEFFNLFHNSPYCNYFECHKLAELTVKFLEEYYSKEKKKDE